MAARYIQSVVGVPVAEGVARTLQALNMPFSVEFTGENHWQFIVASELGDALRAIIFSHYRRM